MLDAKRDLIVGKMISTIDPKGPSSIAPVLRPMIQLDRLLRTRFLDLSIHKRESNLRQLFTRSCEHGAVDDPQPRLYANGSAQPRRAPDPSARAAGWKPMLGRSCNLPLWQARPDLLGVGNETPDGGRA